MVDFERRFEDFLICFLGVGDAAASMSSGDAPDDDEMQIEMTLEISMEDKKKVSDDCGVVGGGADNDEDDGEDEETGRPWRM